MEENVGGCMGAERRYGSTHSNSGDDDEMGGGNGVNKKLRHNKVEQNRRELTRKYVAELQQILPNMADADSGAGINVVLEGALDYLRSVDGAGLGASLKGPAPGHSSSSADAAQAGRRDEDSAGCKLMAGQSCGQMMAGGTCGERSLSSLRFSSAFDSAPYGICIARCDGRLVQYNSMFERVLSFAPGRLAGQTMFSLTLPSDLPYTMQVRAGSSSLFRPESALRCVMKC
jgi:PAS domain-containing protein